MLAKFSDGNYLEVTVREDNHGHKVYHYDVYDEEFFDGEFGYTEYRDIEMYYPKNMIDYILEFCDPDIEGFYTILECETMEEYKQYIITHRYEKYKNMSYSAATGVLRTMLDELEWSCSMIDFDSFDKDEIERAENWYEKTEALKTAIKVLKEKMF